MNFFSHGRGRMLPAADIFSSQSRLALIGPAVAVSKTFVRPAGLEPCDPVIKSHVLYLLSYTVICGRSRDYKNYSLLE